MAGELECQYDFKESRQIKKRIATKKIVRLLKVLSPRVPA
jgi:hypothetical protein